MVHLAAKAFFPRYHLTVILFQDSTNQRECCFLESTNQHQCSFSGSNNQQSIFPAFSNQQLVQQLPSFHDQQLPSRRALPSVSVILFLLRSTNQCSFSALLLPGSAFLFSGPTNQQHHFYCIRHFSSGFSKE
jgi:hypothetical protein